MSETAVIEAGETMPAEQSEQADHATSIVQVIDRAARDPSVDIDKMERLMAMHERIQMRQAEELFNAAMSTAQASMRRISADAENKQTRSKYATYGALDRALRPLYTENGFSLSFNSAQSPLEGHARVECIVSHRGGFSRTHTIDMPNDGKGAKGGDVMTKTHAQGAAMSYGMRYLLKMIFNVAIGEDDTDGNDVSAPIAGEQVENLRARLDACGADVAKFCGWLGVDSLAAITEQQWPSALKAVEAKEAQARG